MVWWSSEHSSSKLPEWRCIFPATLKLGIQINSTVCHSLSQIDKSKSYFEKQSIRNGLKQEKSPENQGHIYLQTKNSTGTLFRSYNAYYKSQIVEAATAV